MATGAGAGIPLVDVRVECLDGKTHSVDSSDMAFKTAAAQGFREAVTHASPVILEPISLLTVTVPTDLQGDVLSDVSTRRGRIVGSDVWVEGARLGTNRGDDLPAAGPAIGRSRALGSRAQK